MLPVSYSLRLRACRVLETLADEARRGNVTLVYAARDTERNSAVVVREALEAIPPP